MANEANRRLRAFVAAHWPLLGCALASIAVALGYLIMTWSKASSLGFPIDDAYIYLTYAKQIGRLEPMTYYPGGPYSAGATSPLWPFVLAPLWSIGFRGGLFVWAAFAVSAVFVAATTVLAFRVVERISNRSVATVAAAGTLFAAPFTYGSLAAMEVGLAATLVLVIALRMADESERDEPSRWLLLLLALTSVSRPELTVLVAGLVLLRAGVAVAKRRPKLALRWLVPLALPLAWIVTNKLIAGNFFPNTGVAKSHFYQPGFTSAYYFDLIPTLFGKMFKGLFWSSSSPLWQPQLVFFLALTGIVRLGMWAVSQRQVWSALLLAGAPIALVCAVIASSGQWEFHNYRYIAPALPWLAVLVALGVSLPLELAARWPWALWPRRIVPFAVTALIIVLSWTGLINEMRYFAQGVRDTNDQVVKIGRFINRELPPDAHIAFHDAGAISYYGDRRGTDILGLVTNRNALHANSGPGSRFERLEHMAPADRPTHFAYYPGWLGTLELYGKTVLQTPLRPVTFKGKPRLVGSSNMKVMEATWDALETGHQPCAPMPGWHVVDRVDVADLENEAAHHYKNDLGPRRYGYPTARWTDVRTGSCGPQRKVTDGGRVTRGKGGERFTVSIDPSKDVRYVIRSGGTDSHWSKTSKAPVVLQVAVDGKPAGTVTVSGTNRGLRDSMIELPATLFSRPKVEITLRATPQAPYRSFQHFVLQVP